ncbi:hypothetical protein MRB53_029191 [Persea americana]|uniref:Uncharacterized protein n=1 Tax=Persea americana TaxID=3435 RepID=A0ACC2KI13_PERAE|nr:hypothetical protein MRB53_029191 [Persea americana]
MKYVVEKKFKLGLLNYQRWTSSSTIAHLISDVVAHMKGARTLVLYLSLRITLLALSRLFEDSLIAA